MVKTDDEEGQLASRAGEKQGVWQHPLPPSTAALACQCGGRSPPSASCSLGAGVVGVQHAFPGEAWPSCPAGTPSSPGPEADSPPSTGPRAPLSAPLAAQDLCGSCSDGWRERPAASWDLVESPLSKALNSLNRVQALRLGTGIGGWGSWLGAGALKRILVLSPIHRLLTQFPPELIPHGQPGELPPCLLPAHVRGARSALGLRPQANGLSGHLRAGGEHGPGEVPALMPSSPQAGHRRARLPRLRGTRHALVAAVPRSAPAAGPPV